MKVCIPCAVSQSNQDHCQTSVQTNVIIWIITLHNYMVLTTHADASG